MKSNFAELVTKKSVEKKWTITFMESCTSGLLASMFTDTPGASEVFKGSLVTYSNEMKIVAGVPSLIIKNFGVYSKECARAMAETVQKKYSTDIAVAITGTTGNIDSTNNDSIQGQAFYCIIFFNKIFDFEIKENISNFNRKQIKQLYADKVFKSLNEILNTSHS